MESCVRSICLLVCSSSIIIGGPEASPAAAGDQQHKTSAKAKKSRPYDPTTQYEVRQIEGWSVLVNQSLLKEHPELCERTLELLRFQLYQIPRKVPRIAVGKLRQVRIWMEFAEPHHPCMAYHPGIGWLKEHGMNPEKVKCVELANAKNFLEWTKAQPWMVLHELAHAYHDQFLENGFNNSEVLAAFAHTQSGTNYKSVLRINGKNDRAYALTNQMEYFAESTEAYFGTNDFYPYVRSELKKYDPRMFDLLGKLWGEKPGKRSKSKGR